jgi:hypothetical protein
LDDDMDDEITAALTGGGIADITTVGRKTSKPRRIEIAFHHLDGEWFLTGKPGIARDWLANLLAEPRFTLHLKRGVEADVPAAAEPITDPDERAAVLFRILTESWDTEPEKARAVLPRWVEGSPLVRFRPV